MIFGIHFQYTGFIGVENMLAQLGECIEWQGSKDAQGYGMKYWKGRTQRVHRISYELFNGPIPEGMCVCHKCDNPSCHRIDHLFLGTHAENMKDKVVKGRANVSKLKKSHVIEIRELLREGNLTHNEIAKIYGVYQSTISRIGSGKRWKHLD